MPERRSAPGGLHAWESGEEIVVGNGETLDELQSSGEFIVSRDAVEVRP